MSQIADSVRAELDNLVTAMNDPKLSDVECETLCTIYGELSWIDLQLRRARLRLFLAEAEAYEVARRISEQIKR